MINTTEFQYYCKTGKLNDAIKFYQLHSKSIDISANDELAFRWACHYRHLEVAKWLLTVKPTINVSVLNNCAFKYACENGNLNIVKWLLTINPTINISANNEWAFIHACINGHLVVAQWLLSIKPTIDISFDNDYAFRCSCFFGKLEVAQWLLTVKPTIDISVYDNFVFKHACEYEKLEVAQWLQSLCPDKYDLVIKNNKLVSYHIKLEIPFCKDPIILMCQNAEELVCPICYSEDKQVEVQTNCGHNYCTSCITDYYNKCDGDCKCPYCRQSVTSFRKLIIA